MAYGMPKSEPKSGWKAVFAPMEFTQAVEWLSRAAPEMSLFHALSAGKTEQSPLRLGLCPGVPGLEGLEFVGF